MIEPTTASLDNPGSAEELLQAVRTLIQRDLPMKALEFGLGLTRLLIKRGIDNAEMTQLQALLTDASGRGEGPPQVSERNQNSYFAASGSVWQSRFEEVKIRIGSDQALQLTDAAGNIHVLDPGSHHKATVDIFLVMEDEACTALVEVKTPGGLPAWVTVEAENYEIVA